MGGARDTNARKLALNWKGPYIITSIARAGAYYLEDIKKRALPRPWNLQNLKKKIIKYVNLGCSDCTLLSTWTIMNV